MEKQLEDAEAHDSDEIRQRRTVHALSQRGDSVPEHDAQSRHWFLTANNPTPDTILNLLSIGGLERYAIQEEEGPEGTPHLQGVLTFRSPKKWSTLRNHVKAYWKPCRNIHAAKNYCTKLASRAGKQWIRGFNIKGHVNDPLEGKTLYAYQRELLEIIKSVPDERKIYWYWSNKGCIGKSCFVKHVVLKHGAIVVGGKHKDAYYAICQRVAKNKDMDTVIFDLPRSQGNKISYVAIEGIKNGLFMSAKYESQMCLYNPPHVIVFANEAPDQSQLSRDRWIVKYLDNDPDLAHIH